MDITFEHENGRPCAQAQPPFESLASFLEVECQNVGFCREVVRMAEEVQQGRRERWMTTGSMHTLLLTEEGAIISIDFADPPGYTAVTLEELRSFLEGWINHCSEHRGAERKPA